MRLAQRRRAGADASRILQAVYFAAQREQALLDEPQLLGHTGHGEIVIGAARHHDVGTLGTESSDDNSAEEPSPTSDHHATTAPETGHGTDATTSGTSTGRMGR